MNNDRPVNNQRRILDLYHYYRGEKRLTSHCDTLLYSSFLAMTTKITLRIIREGKVFFHFENLGKNVKDFAQI